MGSTIKSSTSGQDNNFARKLFKTIDKIPTDRTTILNRNTELTNEVDNYSTLNLSSLLKRYDGNATETIRIP